MAACWKQMNGINMYANDYGGTNNGGNNMMAQKRVMVVVDETSRSKHAMMWALTHVTNKGDWLTLLHIISDSDSSSSASTLASSLGSLCKACKPEVSSSVFFFMVVTCCKVHLFLAYFVYCFVKYSVKLGSFFSLHC